MNRLPGHPTSLVELRCQLQARCSQDSARGRYYLAACGYIGGKHATPSAASETDRCLYQIAASEGYCCAHAALASMIAAESGGLEKERESWKLWESAALLDCAHALAVLARCHWMGCYVEENRAEALMYAERAAVLGDWDKCGVMVAEAALAKGDRPFMRGGCVESAPAKPSS
jgi:hypothetical protein